MSWRIRELAHYASELSWLSAPEARAVWDDAMTTTGKSRYGLAEDLENLARLDVDVDEPAQVHEWLTTRVGVGLVHVVFGRDEVCLTTIAFFVSNRRDMLCPSRDDAVIMPCDDRWVLFYSHMDEFEFGLRRGLA